MLQHLSIFFRYLKFLYVSKNEHSVHSPFVFHLYTKIIKKQSTRKEFTEIENLRKKLLADNSKIAMKDYGAGSSLNKSNIRSISSISKYAEKPADLAQLLFRLVEFFKPTTIFELGTSLGLTTTYLSKAYPEARLYSFEGCPETLKKAIENFHCIGCQNITTIEGNIDDTLKETLSKISSLDFVFFDANHRYKPTLEYFNQCLKKINNNSVFIFDDIHWSSEMEKAWEEIKAHPSVNVSIDLFHLGIIFFRKEQVKEHFILRL